MTNKNMDVESNKNGRNRFQEERHDNDFDKVDASDAEATNDPQAEEKNAMAEKVNEYLRDCLMEKSKMEKTFPIAARLLDNEIEKVQSTGRLPTREPRYADVYREKPIRVSQKVLVPVREHPKFNFVGKLLGPKGNSLRRLQEETLCKMTVLGRNSMKDRAKEEELRASMDPKYAHLNSDLHVEISTIAPPAEAHARIAYAMAELRKYLIPDSNDVIRQEQLRELLVENPNLEFEHKPGLKKSSATAPPTKPPPPYKPISGPPSNNRTAIPPKQKVLSILDKARTAMDESYRYPSHSRHYEEPSSYEPPSSYESYPYAPPSGPTRPPYEPPEYEPEYRREYYSSPGGYPAKSPTSTPRPSWKPTPAGGAYASRRHDEAPPSAGPAPTKHSSREARYKTAPYPRANNY